MPTQGGVNPCSKGHLAQCTLLLYQEFYYQLEDLISTLIPKLNLLTRLKAQNNPEEQLPAYILGAEQLERLPN